jgi:hypothetical protein
VAIKVGVNGEIAGRDRPIVREPNVGFASIALAA